MRLSTPASCPPVKSFHFPTIHKTRFVWQKKKEKNPAFVAVAVADCGTAYICEINKTAFTEVENGGANLP